MRVRTLETEVWLARPLEEVFAFFSDAHNLDGLTPSWLHFRILTPRPIPMRQGTRIDYRLRLHLVPIRWQTEITTWEPPLRFVDEQRRGPYKLWTHTHTFTEEKGGVRVYDHVAYAAPGGWLEPVVHALLVGPDVRRIFAYRKERLRERFGTLG